VNFVLQIIIHDQTTIDEIIIDQKTILEKILVVIITEFALIMNLVFAQIVWGNKIFAKIDYFVEKLKIEF
jgi:hypothetical protein